MSYWVTLILKISIPFVLIFSLVPFLVWLERKGSAYIQDRPGPNRAAILGLRLGGLLHPLADVIKLIFKENIMPARAHRFFYILAPGLALFVASITYLVIPFAEPTLINNELFYFQGAHLNIGILYILALSSLGVYALLLAGWSSNNKFALLGGLRSASQMISYELSLGLALISLIMWTGSLAINDIIVSQTHLPWHWNFIFDPIAFLVFFIAVFAETNRTPFDLPEGESELVAGYHVEYSSLKFAMFFMAEYVHIIIASALMAALFFGGWQIPFVSSSFLREHCSSFVFFGLIFTACFLLLLGIILITNNKKIHYKDLRDFESVIMGVFLLLLGLSCLVYVLLFGKAPLSDNAVIWITAFLQGCVFLFKILVFCWIFIWVRWTLPRMRYDQLMKLGWKILLPLSMANIIVTAIRMIITNG